MFINEEFYFETQQIRKTFQISEIQMYECIIVLECILRRVPRVQFSIKSFMFHLAYFNVVSASLDHVIHWLV